MTPADALAALPTPWLLLDADRVVANHRREMKALSVYFPAR